MPHREAPLFRAALEFRAAAEDRGDNRLWVSGLAVSWTSRNSYGETFVPGAFQRTLGEVSDQKPLPMLWLHQTPVGRWSEYAEERDGLRLGGYLSDTATARDEAAPLLRDGAVNGLSVGFWPVRWQFVDAGQRVEVDTPLGKRVYEPEEPTLLILEADLVETSLVPYPADDQARVDETRAALMTRARELGQGTGHDLIPGSPAETTATTVEPLRRVQMSDEFSAPLEGLKKAVHDLSEIVGQVRDGLRDQAAAQAALADVMEKSKAADAEIRKGYQPEDTRDHEREARGVRTLEQRAAYALERPAAKAAPSLGVSADAVAEFQRASDELVLVSALLKVDPRETRYYRDEFLPALRAMDTGTVAEGKEFVPTELSSNLIERINLPLRVGALFTTLDMPTPTWEIPAYPVARQSIGKATEQTADSGQTLFTAITPATRKISMTAVKFGGRVLVSKELEEDSIVPIMSFIQDEVVDYLQGTLEDALLNGDTAVNHQDSDTTAADDPRKNFDGLRKRALAQAGTRIDGSSASKLTVAHLRANRAKMGKYGLMLGELAHILPITSYYQLLDDTSVITVDKFGAGATVLAGQLGAVDGVPIIVSEYMRTGLNASGVVDGITTTETTALTVHRRGFLRGMRRGMTAEWYRERYAESDQDLFIVSTRQAFTARYPLTTDAVACITYNLDA